MEVSTIADILPLATSPSWSCWELENNFCGFRRAVLCADLRVDRGTVDGVNTINERLALMLSTATELSLGVPSSSMFYRVVLPDSVGERVKTTDAPR